MPPHRGRRAQRVGDATPTSRRPRRAALTFARDAVVIVLAALLASFLVKSFLVRSFFIPSASMEDTLRIDDRILVNELVPGVIPLQRGDVVVFRDPGGWLPGRVVPPPASPVGQVQELLLSIVGLSTQDANDHLVKRVIGLPGDHVSCCTAQDRLVINGTPVDEPFITGRNVGEDRARDLFTVTVPKGSVWVEGDNREDSADSRYHRTQNGGAVPVKDVVGRAFVVSWPISHWSWLSNDPKDFADIPSPSPR